MTTTDTTTSAEIVGWDAICPPEKRAEIQEITYEVEGWVADNSHLMATVRNAHEVLTWAQDVIDRNLEAARAAGATDADAMFQVLADLTGQGPLFTALAILTERIDPESVVQAASAPGDARRAAGHV